MAELRTLAYVVLWATTICQVVLLWLQLRAFARYKHMSFGVLAVGSVLGLALTVTTLLVYLGVASEPPSIKSLYGAALICGIAQAPVAIWGVASLFRSYGQLQQRTGARE